MFKKEQKITDLPSLIIDYLEKLPGNVKERLYNVEHINTFVESLKANITCEEEVPVQDCVYFGNLLSLGKLLLSLLERNKLTFQEKVDAKPIQLQQRLIEAISKEGDLILDPAMGSGSALTACLNTGRNFIGADINN